jgi:hypothetical protein
MILVFPVDFATGVGFSTVSPGFAQAAGENAPEIARNMPIAVKNTYSLPDLNIAIP